jgi:hypothetical protein
MFKAGHRLGVLLYLAFREIRDAGAVAPGGAEYTAKLVD